MPLVSVHYTHPALLKRRGETISTGFVGSVTMVEEMRHSLVAQVWCQSEMVAGFLSQRVAWAIWRGGKSDQGAFEEWSHGEIEPIMVHPMPSKPQLKDWLVRWIDLGEMPAAAVVVYGSHPLRCLDGFDAARMAGSVDHGLLQSPDTWDHRVQFSTPRRSTDFSKVADALDELDVPRRRSRRASVEMDED